MEAGESRVSLVGRDRTTRHDYLRRGSARTSCVEAVLEGRLGELRDRVEPVPRIECRRASPWRARGDRAELPAREFLIVRPERGRIARDRESRR